MTKTANLKGGPSPGLDLGDFLAETDELRRASTDLAQTRVTTIIAVAVLQDLLGPRDLARIARREGVALVVRVPGPEWCAPVERALLQLGSWGETLARTGANRSADKAGVGNEKVADALTMGLNVAGISQSPERFLPSALLTAADINLDVGVPSDRVVRAAIELVTGRRARTIPPRSASGLTLEELATCIRRGSTPAQCRRRLVATARAKAASGTGTNDVPLLHELRGYGDAQVWATNLQSQVEEWRAGRIRWDQIADRAVCLASMPGLGKTTFARSVAKTLGLPFFPTSVASWFAGSGAGYLGEIVNQAEAVWLQAAAAGGPAVVLLDELDGLPNRRSLSNRNRDFWAPLLHSVMLALDSAVSSKTSNLIIIGATNYPEHLDDALIRPGRLNRVITIHPPDVPALAAIMRQHLGPDLAGVDLAPVALLAAGSTGAMVAGWVRSARARARTDGRPMRVSDLVDQVSGHDLRSPEERLAVARHEASHALAIERTGSGTVDYVSIVPRGRFAGRTSSRSRRVDGHTLADVEAQVVSALAGRAADELWGAVTSGAGGHPASDLGIATALLTSVHCAWGLGGDLVFRGTPEDAGSLIGGDADLRLRVEADLRRLQARARALVEGNRAAIERLAIRLAEEGLVGGAEVRRILAAPDPVEGARNPEQGATHVRSA